MAPIDITKYGMAIPAAQFPLIAHLVKWMISSDDVEVSRAYMILDGKRYQDGIFTSYMMQVHDMIMLRPINALIAATITIDEQDFTVFLEVYEGLAKLSFGKDDS